MSGNRKKERKTETEGKEVNRFIKRKFEFKLLASFPISTFLYRTINIHSSLHRIKDCILTGL